MEKVKKLAIVYVLYWTGGLVLVASFCIAIAALVASTTTVEGSPSTAWFQAAIGAVSGFILLALATAVDLLHRIATTVETIRQGQLSSTKSLPQESQSGI